MKRIKQFFTAAGLCTLINFTAHAQQSITPEQAAQHINDSVTVCGLIYYSVVPNISKDEPLVLCMGAAAPNQPLSIVVTQIKRNSFSYDPEKKLVNKNVCVSGVIATFRDKPAIMISDEKQFLNIKE